MRLNILSIVVTTVLASSISIEAQAGTGGTRCERVLECVSAETAPSLYSGTPGYVDPNKACRAEKFRLLMKTLYSHCQSGDKPTDQQIAAGVAALEASFQTYKRNPDGSKKSAKGIETGRNALIKQMCKKDGNRKEFHQAWRERKKELNQERAQCQAQAMLPKVPSTNGADQKVGTYSESSIR